MAETKGKILQTIASNDRRGAEIFGVQLGEALQQRGWRVHTVALAPGAISGLDVPTLGHRRLGVDTIRALRRAGRNADVVIAHGSSALPACAAASALSSSWPPFVYRSIGDPTFWTPTGARRHVHRVMLRRAEAVVALWPGAADAFRRLGVAAERVHVAPNGVPATDFPPAAPDRRAAARADLGLDPSAPVLLYLGALSHEKDLSTLLGAAARLSGVQLVIAGDGPDRRAVEAGARAAGPDVHLIGNVTDPAWVLATADVVVLSSITEGLPGALIEAGLSGIPCVTTDVGGVREIVVDGETGFVVPPRDPDAFAAAIRRALDERVPLGLAARERCVTRFDLDVVAERWEAVIDGAVSGERVGSTCEP